MKRFLKTVLLSVCVFVVATPILATEFMQESVYVRRMNVVLERNEMSTIVHDTGLSEIIRVMAKNGFERPDGFRNYSNWVRSYMNEADLHTTRCIVTRFFDGDVSRVNVIVNTLQESMLEREFNSYVGYHIEDDRVIFVLVR